MEVQNLSSEWLFQRHTEEEIKKWIRNLEYSYFIRAWGGHANDGDEFSLTLRYNSKSDLLDILNRLNIKLSVIPRDHARPIPGKTYTHDEYAVLRSEIEDYPGYKQPGRTEVSGIKCFCWIERGRVEFTFSGAADGNLYEVSELDFENCRMLEQIISKKQLIDKVSRDRESSVTCISRRRYLNLA